MRSQLLVLPVITMVAALLVAGCGEDTTTASITKGQFIKKASALCAKGQRRIVADFRVYVARYKKTTRPTRADFETLVTSVLGPNIKKEVAEIRALGAPRGDEDEIDAMLTAREESLRRAESKPRMAVEDSGALFAEENKLAKEYGLKGCAKR